MGFFCHPIIRSLIHGHGSMSVLQKVRWTEPKDEQWQQSLTGVSVQNKFIEHTTYLHAHMVIYIIIKFSFPKYSNILSFDINVEGCRKMFDCG